MPPGLRLALLARRLPQGRRARVPLAGLAVVAIFWAIGASWGWPEALTPHRLRP